MTTNKRAAEKVLISIRLDPLLSEQVKIVAQAHGGLSKWAGEVFLKEIREIRNDPDFMEVLYRDE